MAFGFEAEVLQPARFGPFGGPPGQRAGHLFDVVLGVGAPVGAEREQLHHLAGVVLVRFPAAVVDAVEEHQHRRVRGDRQEQVVEVPQRLFAEQVVLFEHPLLVVDLFVGVREPVVPDVGHPLHQRLIGADHAVQPPAVVVTPVVGRLQRFPFFVVRFGPVQDGGPRRPREAEDDLLQGLTDERLGLARRRPEAGPPQQPPGPGEGERVFDDRRRRGRRRRRVDGHHRRRRSACQTRHGGVVLRLRLVLVLVVLRLVGLVLAELGPELRAVVLGLAVVVCSVFAVGAVRSLRLAQRGGAGPRHGVASAAGRATMSAPPDV